MEIKEVLAKIKYYEIESEGHVISDTTIIESMINEYGDEVRASERAKLTEVMIAQMNKEYKEKIQNEERTKIVEILEVDLKPYVESRIIMTKMTYERLIQKIKEMK